MDLSNRTQPWSTYAVYQTTVVQWAFFWDWLIIYSYLLYSEPWDYEIKTAGLTALLTWMLVSKFIKLLGHYIRYPADFLLLPISIAFGYLHGLIKAKAMLSLNVVSRGFLTPTFHDTYPAVSMPECFSDYLLRRLLGVHGMARTTKMHTA